MVFIIRAGAHSLAWHPQIKIMRRLAQICFFYFARNGWFYWCRPGQVFRGPCTEERLVPSQHSLVLSNTFYADKEEESFPSFHGLNLKSTFYTGIVNWLYPQLLQEILLSTQGSGSPYDSNISSTTFIWYFHPDPPLYFYKELHNHHEGNLPLVPGNHLGNNSMNPFPLHVTRPTCENGSKSWEAKVLFYSPTFSGYIQYLAVFIKR